MNAPDRISSALAGPVAFGPFVLDHRQARLSRDGEAVALSGRPLEVLALLAARAGQLVDKDTVLDEVWGHRHVTESVLKVAVNALRAALGDDAKAPRYVETVPRRGYRFVAEVRPVVAAPARPSGAAEPAAPALIGRERDLDHLAALLASSRLVTLCGLGGVGKTRLALAAAAVQDRQGAWPDGVWVVRLESLSDPVLLPSSIAQALQLGARAGGGTAALAQALAPLHLLLVLDNAEHMVEAVAALVASLLEAAPRVTLLVTSQVPLRVGGEQVMPLAPLALPQDVADPAPPPEGYAAARLFCARVRQWQPGYAPTPDEHAAIAAICRSLDGVPLALELAAARVPLLGTAGVRTRLSQRFALLTRGARDAAARQRSLTAALDWTYGLLSPQEQRALQWLSVFAGSVTPDAAEAQLAGLGEGAEPLDLVAALLERSLLVPEATPEGPRLCFFNSVRRYALERLAEAGEEAAARAAHLRRLVARFGCADADEFQTPMHRWLPPLRRELDNLRAALRFGLGAEPPLRDDALRLLCASAAFWAVGGLRVEGLRWFDEAQAVAPPEGELALLLAHARGMFAARSQLGSPQQALELLRQARPLLRERGDHRRLYQSRNAERYLLMRLASQEDVSELLADMASQVQPGWNIVARRHLLHLQAYALRDRGDLEGYRQACAALLEACKAEGAEFECWPVANALGQALVQLGRLDEACRVLGAAAAQVWARGMQREQVPLLAIHACVQLFRGAGAEAIQAGREAAALLRAEGMLWWMADALPWAAWGQGRHDDARRLQAWADAQVSRRGETRGPLFSRLRQAFADVAGMPVGAPPPGGGGAELGDAAAAALAFGA
ncbi:helix-turn-helix transcriptional regulator [Pelomonas sp. P7]|uniref:Helix-turn-helix transcriptional regulator n=1 Tax=Pelomonas caseinilytica TaxID=2906763 RepID=A0ABS8X9P0_9BURK|nr:helix-turn-helix transcriptional regulator [Pelomonas sp. P7]